MEALHRGTWCEPMSNRYYYSAIDRKCKGFHYTGCGNSANNFYSIDECQMKCIDRKMSTIDRTTSTLSNQNHNNTACNIDFGYCK